MVGKVIPYFLHLNLITLIKHEKKKLYPIKNL